MEFHALAGMKDYLGNTAEELTELIRIGRDQLRSAGYREINTPVMEDARLFDRSLGSESDIISKEMYTIEQSDDRAIALRPENTAGVVRSVIEQGLMSRHNQLKLFYAGPMFRHERPQSGRLRQFHQVGAEVFGRSDPFMDAEVIKLAQEYLDGLSLPSFNLKLNSLGTPETRWKYIQELKDRLEPYLDDLCEDCNRRFETDPLRMLDCKNEACREIYNREAPNIIEHLDADSESHFRDLRSYLDAWGIDYEIDPFLVRGLDYYTRTTFEFVTDALGSQDAILAGGRYDRLTEQLGGEHCPAIGFAAGLERLMILRNQYEDYEVDTSVDCFLVTFGDRCLREILPLLSDLRRSEYPGKNRRIRAELGEPETSVKSKMRRANRYGAKVVLLLGDDELEAGEISAKRMDTGDQIAIPFENRDETINRIIDLVDDVDVSELGQSE